MQRADARRNREKLLVAARAAIYEKGPDVDVREIASRAGMGLGTFYRHFETKDVLIDLLVEEATLEWVQIVEGALANPDVAKAFRTFLDQGLAFSDKYGRSLDFRLRLIAAHRERHMVERAQLLIGRALEAGVIDHRFSLEFVHKAILALFSLNFPDETTGVKQSFSDQSLVLLIRGLSSSEDAQALLF